MQDTIYKMMNLIPVAWNERIQFECHHCGTCCRNIKESVPLESLDVYQIAKLLKEQNNVFASIDAMLFWYAVPIPLNECGYFIYALKTVKSLQKNSSKKLKKRKNILLLSMKIVRNYHRQ